MGVWLFFIIVVFVEISELNANSVDPDQTPHSAASDLDLHCLLMSLLWDARLIWVKKTIHHYAQLWKYNQKCIGKVKTLKLEW